MISYSIIQKSQLEGALRLDAEYYQSEYFIDFSKGRWQPIGNALSLCQYGISQSMNDKKAGYPIFKMDDINNGFLFDDEVRFTDIPAVTFKEFQLRKDDVLFNRVNSEEFVGRTGIYKFIDLEAVFASYLIRMQTKPDGEVLPDYLNIFLNSAYGLKQIRKFARRAVNQANVNAEELKQIKIAILSRPIQKKIAELSNEAWQEFQNSKSLYSQAENLLLEELGFKDFEIEEDLSYTVNLSDVKSAHRADAEYFQPKYEEIIQKLSSKNTSRLNDHFNIIKSKNFSYSESGEIGVTQTKQLGKTFIKFDVENKAKKETIEKEKLPILIEQDVVFASMGVGSLGKTNIFYDFEAGTTKYTIDSTLRIFRAKEKGRISPEVLNVFLASWVGQELIYKYIVGTSGIISIYEDYLKNFPVSIFPKSTQQKIADLVRKSHQARRKAKELLEKAKQMVESLIEARDYAKTN